MSFSSLYFSILLTKHIWEKKKISFIFSLFYSFPIFYILTFPPFQLNKLVGEVFGWSDFGERKRGTLSSSFFILKPTAFQCPKMERKWEGENVGWKLLIYPFSSPKLKSMLTLFFFFFFFFLWDLCWTFDLLILFQNKTFIFP